MNNETLTPEAEQALLRRFVGSGDPQAFSIIARHYAGLVYGACLRVTGNEERAADTAQETFFHLARHGREVTGSLAGWLHRVAVGKSVDLVRSEIARHRREQAYAAVPRETDRWSELSPLVDEAMMELEEESREILVRYYLDGETLATIAAAKEISPSTASRHIEAALEQLRLRLKSKGVLVAALTLGGLMSNATASAPAAVLAELGKMGLAGSGAAAASSATATWLGLNAKLAIAGALAVAGVGGYVAYRAIHPSNTDLSVAAAPPMVMVTSSAGNPSATVADVPNAAAGEAPPVAAAPMTVVSTDPAPIGGVMVSRGGRGVPSGGTVVSTATAPQSPPTRATTEGALTLFANALYAMALGRSDLARLEECFAGPAEATAFRQVLENPANDTERELQQALKSLGPVIEVVQSTAIENGLKVKWTAPVRQPFTTTVNGAARTWHPGDRYELEVRLKQIGDEWKIVGF